MLVGAWIFTIRLLMVVIYGTLNQPSHGAPVWLEKCNLILSLSS